jgi:hypothetical protein
VLLQQAARLRNGAGENRILFRHLGKLGRLLLALTGQPVERGCSTVELVLQAAEAFRAAGRLAKLIELRSLLLKCRPQLLVFGDA